MDGARYAGIQVDRRLLTVYVISGLLASLSAIIYVAHLGQAKADAGTGYELMAITAVVLGGTSIFGGYGSIAGSMLGLLAIAILQNGLRLSDLPAELSGILSGALLLTTICLGKRRTPASTDNPSAHNVEITVDESSSSPSPLTAPTHLDEEFEMKNTQLASCVALSYWPR